jgi:hypothetical protein
MQEVKRHYQLGPKFALAQAIIKKYKETIFWKHKCKLQREERRNTHNLPKSEIYRKSAPVKKLHKHPQFVSSDLGLDRKKLPKSGELETKLMSSSLVDSSLPEVQVALDPYESANDYKNCELVPQLLDYQESNLSIVSLNRGYYRRRYTKYEEDYYVNYIYMTDIAKILYSDEVFIILKENKEVVKFLRDEAKDCNLMAIAVICQSNCKEMLKKKIEICEVKTLTDEIGHITQHYNEGTNYTAAIYLDEAYYLDPFNNIRKVYLRVDRENLHVMKEKSSGIFVSAHLSGLKFVYIYEVMPIVKTHAEL